MYIYSYSFPHLTFSYISVYVGVNSITDHFPHMLTHTYSAGSPTVMSSVLFCGRFSIRCTSLLSNQILQTCRWIPSKANTWDECILNSPKLPSNIMGIRFCNKCYIITWSHLFDRRTLEENFIANIINNIYKQEKKNAFNVQFQMQIYVLFWNPSRILIFCLE